MSERDWLGGLRPEDREAIFGWPTPPQEWLDEQRKLALGHIATAAVREPTGPDEPTERAQEQREHAAMAQTLLWFGSRIEALERRIETLDARSGSPDEDTDGRSA